MLLSDIFFCFDAKIKLIFVSQLMLKRGVDIIFHPTVARIQTPGRTFLANIHYGLYLLNFWSNEPCNNTAHASYSIIDPTFQLWRKKMGYLGKQNVKRLQKMSTGMARSNNAHLCTDYILGRMKEKPHNKPLLRGEYPLEYIHTNIAGLFPVVGYNKYWYWVTFLDNATQLSTTIPITYKSEMFAKLRKFLAKYKRPKR